MQRDLIENYNFPKEKSVVINNPLDIKRIERLSLKNISYPFSDNRIKLISVGQLRYEKRQDLLIEAFAKLDSRYTLTIVGDGVKREELEQLASNLNIRDRVSFLGYIKNPYSYIKNSDILVLTSEYEGFPNVVLEANICGVPVVSFNSIGGVSEIIKEKINGFLVPYRDIDGLAKSIKDVREDSFDKDMIKEITAQKYNIELIIKKYEDILKG
jgi:glycosyltransferase involved in cell wall biosynthesis